MKKTYLLFPLTLGLLLGSCALNGQNSSESKPKEEEATASSASAEQPTSTSESSAEKSSSSESKESSSSSEASSSEASSSVDTEGPFIKEKTEITFMSNSSYGDLLDSFIESFQKLEPNVTVTNTKESASYDGVKDKVIEQIAVKNYPDLVVLYPDAIGTLMDYGIVTQLDDYIGNPSYGWSEDDLDDYVPTYLEEGTHYTVEGTYSLPFAKSTEAMFYNKGVLINLNLSSIDPTINEGKPLSEEYINNLTWDELFDKLCPAIMQYNDTLDDDHKILKDNGTYTKAIFGYDSDDNFFITLAEQHGYGYTAVDPVTGEGKLLFNIDDIDSDGDGVNDTNGMKQLVKKFKGAYDKGYLFTKGSSNGGNYTNYSFTADSCLFTIGSTGGLKYQVASDGHLDTAVARIPQAPEGDGHKTAIINQGPSICLLDHGDDNRTLASWLFYKHMTNSINSLRWSAETGYSPIRYSSMESTDYLDIASEEGKTAGSLDMVKARVASYVARKDVADYLYTSPVFKGSDEAREQVGSIITTVFTKEGADEAFIDETFDAAENTVKTKM